MFCFSESGIEFHDLCAASDIDGIISPFILLRRSNRISDGTHESSFMSNKLEISKGIGDGDGDGEKHDMLLLEKKNTANRTKTTITTVVIV